MAIGVPVVVSRSLSGENSGSKANFDVVNQISVGTQGRYTVLGVHGFGLLNDRAIANAEDAARALGRTHNSPESIGASIRGSLTVYLWDSKTGNRVILTDPLGSGIVFYWVDSWDSSKWAISSSLNDLKNVLTSKNVRLEKSLSYLALLGAVGHGGVFPSSYEGVEALPQFGFFVCSSEQFKIAYYSNFREEFFDVRQGSPEYYECQLERLRDEVIENINRVSEYPASAYICQLTGGMDSRTVLAALSATDYLNRYATFTTGAPTSPDMVIARAITRELGLRATQFSGVSTVIAPPNIQEGAQWSMLETGGLLSGLANIGLRANPNSVVLSGGYGEFLRGVFGEFAVDSSVDKKRLWLRKILLGLGDPTNKRIAAGGIFSDKVVERTERVVDDVLSSHVELGLPDDALPELMYFQVKNRYFVGETTRSMSAFAYRFDPLYAKSIFGASLSCERKKRFLNFVQLDFGRKFNPKLMALPYDTPRISPEYLKHNMDFSPAEFSFDGSPKFVDHYPGSVHRIPGSVSSKITPQEHAEAERVGMPARFVANCADNQRVMAELLEQIDQEVLAKTFRLEALDSLVRKMPDSRPAFRMIQNLHDALVWYQG